MNVSWETEFKVIAARYAEQIAVSSGSESITFRALFNIAAGVANYLAAKDLGPGIPVAAMIPNSIAAVSASLGITLSGSTEVPVNPALSSAERSWCLELARAKHLITARGVTLDGVPSGVETHFIEDIGSADIQSGHWAPPGPDDWSRILFTSGTTGHPKGVMHTQHGRWLANVLLAMSLPFRPGPEDKVLLMTPFSHGASLLTYAFLTNGAPVQLVDGVQPDEVLAAIRSGAVRHVFAPPTVLTKIVAALGDERIEGIQTIFTGTAPLSHKLYFAVRKLFGPVVRVTYGMTEIFNPITVLESAECDAAYGVRDEDAAACVGWPAPGVEVSIRQENGLEAEPGTVGEVYLRARHMYAGYLMPDGFRPLAENAFHPTGDVGYFDSRRGLRLMARRHDIIKTGGYKIFPQEIEAALMKSLPSGEIMVIGIPSEYWGEIILAAGEETSGTWESHARKAAAALTRYKRPRFYISMPALPRNPAGKLDRRLLKQIVSKRYRLTDGPHPRLDPID